MSDLLKKYNEQSWKLAYYPEANRLASGRNNSFQLNPRLLDSQLDDSFNKTNLDLENPAPIGGPINVSYTTKVGAEVVTSSTTQPYTPTRTYADSLKDKNLIARTIDPYK